jgi:hypothetical protein
MWRWLGRRQRRPLGPACWQAPQTPRPHPQRAQQNLEQQLLRQTRWREAWQQRRIRCWWSRRPGRRWRQLGRQRQTLRRPGRGRRCQRRAWQQGRRKLPVGRWEGDKREADEGGATGGSEGFVLLAEHFVTCIPPMRDMANTILLMKPEMLQEIPCYTYAHCLHTTPAALGSAQTYTTHEACIPPSPPPTTHPHLHPSPCTSPFPPPPPPTTPPPTRPLTWLCPKGAAAAGAPPKANPPGLGAAACSRHKAGAEAQGLAQDMCF